MQLDKKNLNSTKAYYKQMLKFQSDFGEHHSMALKIILFQFSVQPFKMIFIFTTILALKPQTLLSAGFKNH